MAVLRNMARGAGAAMLAQKATTFEAFDGGTISRSIEPHTARDYFRKYGTMLHRFDYNADYNVYYGYVCAFNRPEFLSFVGFKDDYAIIVSYETHTHGLGLAEAWELRQHFADRCMLKVRLKVLNFVAPVSAPAPPPTPVAPPLPSPLVATPATKNSKGGGVPWLVILLLIVSAGWLSYLYLEGVKEERDKRPDGVSAILEQYGSY